MNILDKRLDIFIPAILDGNFKNDMGSMEHPMFALRAGDQNIRKYEHNGNKIEITPSVLGLATIFDKDILIYCTSLIVNAMNKGERVSRKIRLTAIDLLITTKRKTDGEGYKRLREALKRLKGTMVTTNIKAGGYYKGFSLIDEWEVEEESSRMVWLDITLSKWLYNAILNTEVLTIDRDYFRIRKPLERRLYELTRKHCGNQNKWKIELTLLKKKSGSQASIKEFRRLVIDICKYQNLPSYRIHFDDKKRIVTFYNRSRAGSIIEIKDELTGIKR